MRVQTYHVKSPGKLVLRPKQELLLKLLRDHGSLSPAEIWAMLVAWTVESRCRSLLETSITRR
jgi:hypothetical protein